MSLALQVTTVICGFILPRSFLEHYGSDVNGLTQSIAQFLSIISFLELGVGQVIQSSLYTPLASGDTENVSKMLKSGTNYFRKIACTIIGYVIILGVFSPYIFGDKYELTYTITLILIMGIGSFAQYYFGLIDKILLAADERGYAQYGVTIIVQIINVVVVLYFIQQGSSIQIVKLISALIFLLIPIFVRIYVNKNYKIDRKIKYDEDPIKQKWSGIAQHVSSVVLEGTDVVILTIFSTLSNVSIYSVYYMVVSGVRQLYTAATAGVQSKIGKLWAKGEQQIITDVFQGVEVILHFAVVFLFSCIAILVVPFVQVYTYGITDCNYIQPVFAMVLTLAYAIRSLRTPYNIMVLAASHYKQTQTCHIIAAILNIVISIVAVMIWGLVGIAIGTLVAFVFQTAWIMIYTSKHLLNRSIIKIIQLVAVDLLAVVLIYVSTFWISMREISYLGWFLMAVCVAGIAFLVITILAIVFYFPRLKTLIRALKK